MSTNLQPITAEQARRLAGEYAAEQMRTKFKTAEVVDGKVARLGVYLPEGGEFWVVYEPREVIEFQSSEVVLVCKRTGRILRYGSACDEG